MDQMVDRSSVPVFEMPRVRRVDPGQPWVWLRRGWADLTRLGGISLAFGALIAGLGLLLLGLAWGATYLVPALIGGFLLVAPFVAIIFYALSRQIERGKPIDVAAACFSWRANVGSIALWGLLLGLALIAWERIAAIVFALFWDDEMRSTASALADAFLSGQHLTLALVFFAVGAVFAAAVFAFGVVTAPLLLDRPVDVVTAALTSLRCCAANPGTVLLWALLIAALTLFAAATAMIGMVVVFPWLGHASWHAYRDLVES